MQGWVHENEEELYLLKTRPKWDISVDVQAPIFLIPERIFFPVMNPVLIFDLGHFALANQDSSEEIFCMIFGV